VNQAKIILTIKVIFVLLLILQVIIATITPKHFSLYADTKLPDTDSNLRAQTCQSAFIRGFPQSLQVFYWINWVA
jgi:hypothetical protein